MNSKPPFGILAIACIAVFLAIAFLLKSPHHAPANHSPNQPDPVRQALIEDDSTPWGMRCWCGAEIVAFADTKDGFKTRCAGGHQIELKP